MIKISDNMENRGEQINWEYSIKEKKTNYLFKNIFFNTDKYTLNGDIVVEDRYVAQFTMRFSPESEWKKPPYDFEDDMHNPDRDKYLNGLFFAVKKFYDSIEIKNIVEQEDEKIIVKKILNITLSPDN